MQVNAIRWSAGWQTTPLSVLLGGTGRRQVRLVSVPSTETPPALLRPWQAPGQHAGSSSAHDPAR